MMDHAPQSTVLAHRFLAGLLAASQLDVLQVTVPGVPEPAATPHLVAHPLASPCTHLPNICMWSNQQRRMTRRACILLCL